MRITRTLLGWQLPPSYQRSFAVWRLCLSDALLDPIRELLRRSQLRDRPRIVTILSGIVIPADLDGDGIDDLAVNAPFDDDGRHARGAVWLLLLNSDGSVKDVDGSRAPRMRPFGSSGPTLVQGRANEVFRHVYRAYPTLPSPYYEREAA